MRRLAILTAGAMLLALPAGAHADTGGSATITLSGAETGTYHTKCQEYFGGGDEGIGFQLEIAHGLDFGVSSSRNSLPAGPISLAHTTTVSLDLVHGSQEWAVGWFENHQEKFVHEGAGDATIGKNLLTGSLKGTMTPVAGSKDPVTVSMKWSCPAPTS